MKYKFHLLSSRKTQRAKQPQKLLSNDELSQKSCEKFNFKMGDGREEYCKSLSWSAEAPALDLKIASETGAPDLSHATKFR